MINLREKMIFPSGTRQRGAEFAITNRATKRRDSTDNPQHKQREPGLNVRQLKTKARENSGADDVGNHNGRRREKTDSALGSGGLHRNALIKSSHRWVNGCIQVHDSRTSPISKSGGLQSAVS